LADDGILIRSPKREGSKSQYYELNPNDLRASSLSLIEGLLTVGAIESRIKEDQGMPSSVMLKDGLMDMSAQNPWSESSHWTLASEPAANPVVSGRSRVSFEGGHVRPIAGPSGTTVKVAKPGWSMNCERAEA
jgi:hypothetical protein